tara:strand:- start:66 stop:515 length:450 start_codon:yes stop_codon:yes gene_type:complete
MPKLTVREQEALTETIINKIQKAEADYAKEDFKLIEKEINNIKSAYQHMLNEKTDLKNKLNILDKQHEELVDKFNKNRKFVAYKKTSHDFYNANVLDEWGICSEENYTTKDDISRDVIVSTLRTNEDMEKLIVDLVNAYQPWRKLKIAS